MHHTKDEYATTEKLPSKKHFEEDIANQLRVRDFILIISHLLYCTLVDVNWLPMHIKFDEFALYRVINLSYLCFPFSLFFSLNLKSKMQFEGLKEQSMPKGSFLTTFIKRKFSVK